MASVELHWKFINDHEWMRLFADESSAMLAVYDFGLMTHPYIKSIWINHTDQSGNIISTKTVL